MWRNMIQAMTRCRFTPLVLALVVTDSLWGGAATHDNTITSHWQTSSSSTEIPLLFNAPLDIEQLVQDQTAQYAVTPYNPNAETSAPTVSDIYSCVLGSTSIPNLLDCGEIPNFLRDGEAPLLISGAEPATVYTLYLAFPGVAALDTIVYYRHIRSAVGSALPRLVRAQGDSLLLRVSFTVSGQLPVALKEYT